MVLSLTELQAAHKGVREPRLRPRVLPPLPVPTVLRHCVMTLPHLLSFWRSSFSLRLSLSPALSCVAFIFCLYILEVGTIVCVTLLRGVYIFLSVRIFSEVHPYDLQWWIESTTFDLCSPRLIITTSLLLLVLCRVLLQSATCWTSTSLTSRWT